MEMSCCGPPPPVGAALNATDKRCLRDAAADVQCSTSNSVLIGVFTLVTRGRLFDVGVKNFTLTPTVGFLTSTQKTTARHPI